MWMPSQIPGLAAELAAMGMELDPARLADLTGDPLGAVVSLGGCTASFVSPEGLIVTNHHCVTGTIQYHSTPERDLLADGFLAATRTDELAAAPGSYVYVTSAIRDVTAEVVGDPRARLSDLDYLRQVERRERELVDACERPGGVRCRVASFFEGALFLEITQRELRDVRLVYAPADGIGTFGGEIDNWMWPRHTGDFAFLRAYVGPDGAAADPAAGNVPYRPRHWLRVSTRGVGAGDLVWIPGYPGRTFRHRTADELETAATFTMPRFVQLARELNALLAAESQRGKAVALANYGRIRGNANYQKKFEGTLLGLRDGGVATARREREAALRDLLARDPKLAAELGDPLTELARLEAARRASEEQELVLTWLDRASPMLSQAIKLWRLAEERPKPDLEREEGFRDRDLPRFRQALARTQRGLEPESDRAGLRWALELALALPPEQRLAVIDARLAASRGATEAERLEGLLDALYAGTRVADLATRQQMAAESTEQLLARGDTLLDFARALSPLLTERRERERAHLGAMLRVRPRYLRGLERLASGRLYPDANSTLRVTFGEVDGFSPQDGVEYLPRTTLAGLLAKDRGEPPFASPGALLEASASVPAAYLDPRLGDLPVNFLSTCDITNGNSGSPTLDGRGELVGLAFDGNFEGVGSDHGFDPRRTRTIHVDAVYMRWVMDAVDRAHHLLREMGLPVHSKD